MKTLPALAVASVLCASWPLAAQELPAPPPGAAPAQPPVKPPAGAAGGELFAGVEPIPDAELTTWRSTSESLLRKVNVLNLLLGAVSAEGGSEQSKVEAMRNATVQKAAALRAEATRLVGGAAIKDLSANALGGAAGGVAAVAATATTAGQQFLGNAFAGFLGALAESDQKAAQRRREKAQQLVAEAAELEGKLGELQQTTAELARGTAESAKRLGARRDYLLLLSRVMALTAQSEDSRKTLADLSKRLPALEVEMKQLVAGGAAR